MLRPAVLAFALSGVGGCVGSIGDGADVDPGTSAPGPASGGASPVSPAGTQSPEGHPAIPGQSPLFRCDRASVPAELPLRRLSNLQIRNTVRAFVSRVAPASATQILPLADSVLTDLPSDWVKTAPGQKRGGFSRLDQAVQQEHVSALHEIATLVGSELTRTAARRTEVFGACATDNTAANDAACLDTFLRTAAARTSRHPFTADDLAFYTNVVGANPVDPAGLSDMVVVMLTAPSFFYLVEHGQPGTQDPADLDAYELASRLSYHLTQAPPDDALWAAAANGSLLTADGYRAQVERLLADPRSSGALDEFFGEWLRLEELPPLDALDAKPAYKAFVGADLPAPTLRQAMMDDVLAAARSEARAGGTLSTLLSNRRSYARDPSLAKIVATPAWSGVGDGPAYTSPARVGLLTRPAFLATGIANTRPIMKGLFIRNGLMCETLPDPPPGANDTTPAPSPTATTRETVEQLTEQPGSQCAACHKVLLNPLGFATENFDALGRERQTEAIFDQGGRKLADRPVRTDSIPNVIAGDARPSAGAADVTRLIDQSGRVHSCLARQYFRFSFARVEDEARDGCSLARLEELALGGKSLAEVMREAAYLPTFKKRSFR